MAQTIALQRGTTTVTTNGTSVATLFTQSGGIATRVIVNQLCFTTPTILDGGTTRFALYYYPSGGKSSLLGYYVLSSQSATCFQFTPHSSNNFTVGTIGTNNSMFNFSAPAIHSGSTEMGTNVGSISVNTGSTTITRYSAIPSTFYIGPSDSLKVAIEGSNSSTGTQTATVSYSFTTITES